jgi:two-component system, OmpR family, sensor kinase
MAQPGNRAGFWRSVRQLPDRTPLRVKMMSAVLALVAIALVVISVAGIQILKTSLLGTDDSALESQVGSAVHSVASYLGNGETGEAPSAAVDWIPQGGKVQQVVYPVRYISLGVGGASGPAMSPPAVSSDPAWIAAHLNHPFTLDSQSGTIQWRVLMEQVPNASGTLVYAVDASSVYTTIGNLDTIDLLVSIAVIALVAILGFGLIRASLRPLNDIEETAGAIAAGDLSMRVPDRDPRTEVGRLGRSLNVMLSQIESAFESQSRSEAAAKRSEERMRQFVADASHELRTPLTAIRGFAEYYRQRGGVAVGEAGPAESKGAGEATQAVEAANLGRHARARALAPADMDRIMRRVEQESARMGILVEDMLLLARLDQQRPLTASPVDLLTLAADAVHDARVVAPARSIHLTVRSTRALLVIGDEVRLRQVIGNLMTNAITHTPDGTPIDVVIRSGNLDEAAAATAVAGPDAAEPTWEDGPADDDWSATDDWATADDSATAADMRWDADHVPPPPPAPDWPTGPAPAGRVLSGPAAVLEVTDHGPGLTAEQAEHVFERFYRADPARSIGGTGLGLAIVAALVAAHGGAAWVRTRPGEGATFCIALPLSPEATQAPENDLDPDTGELSAVDSSTGESGPADSGASSDGTGPTEPAPDKPTEHGPDGPTEDAVGEPRSGEPRTPGPATAYTASAIPRARGLS